MSNKTSVLFINRVYPPYRGATGRVLRDVAHAMAASGWDVHVLTTGPKKETEMDGPVRVTRVKGPLKDKDLFSYGIIWAKLFIAGMKMPRPDLIVTMTDPPMLILAGRFLASQKKTRHMHWCQDLYPDLLPSVGMNVSPPTMQFFRKLSRKSMKKCDKVVTIGRCMAKQITHSGVEPSRVAVIPNWPDIEIVQPANDHVGMNGNGTYKPFLVSENAVIRPVEEQVKDESPKFRILYAGNIGRVHPVGSILEAAEKLAHRSEIEFCFVGEGPVYDRLAAERAKRALNNVRFLPFQPMAQLRHVLESGDIHLVSMKEEAAGMLVPCKFYSSLAVGRPCIFMGPEDSEIARVIRDFNAGLVIPTKDPERLVEAIMYYRDNSDNWFASQRGAAEAGSVFIPEQSIQAWIKRAQDSLTEPLY